MGSSWSHEKLNNEGWHYLHQFRRSGELFDIEQAIEYGTRALDMTPEVLLVWADRLGDLGVFYNDRFRHSGNLEDLETAIEHNRQALALSPDGHPDLICRHDSLGLSYSDRYKRLGELNDLEKAIEHESQALKLTPEGDPDLSERLAHLAASYGDRFKRLGGLNDLEMAIKHESRALELTPNAHENSSDRHSNLGVSYRGRFQRLGELDDLTKAIECFSDALKSAPKDYPHLSNRHANLGVAYRDRFERLGESNDLEKAIKHFLDALVSTPSSHPDLSDRYAHLGVAYTDRFERQGELNDLDKAIEHLSRALKLTPDGHPELSDRHANLGVAYSARYKRLREFNDLEEAIKHDSCALDLTPDGHPDLSTRHTNLGVSYGLRFQRLDKFNDLEMAIEHHSYALVLTPNGHPDLFIRHVNLGGSSIIRFHRLGELNDLEEAIEHQSRALELTPKDHPDLSSWHANLGASYRDRFQCLGEFNDLEKAIEHNSRALRLTSDGDPLLPGRYFGQALSLFLRSQHTGDSCMDQALDYFRRASKLSSAAPRKVFQNAFNWAKLAANHESLNCIEAYHVTMSLLPQFIWLGSSTIQRYEGLSTAKNLAVQAASAAILHSDPKLALEWVEQARCVVWNQSLMLRSPLGQLRSSHPKLASRLQSVSEQLHAASSETPASQSLVSGSVDLEHAGQHRRSLAKEYSDLLTQARSLPGFEDFLQPMKADTLVRAARDGPVVVLICHNERCDALLILPHQSDIDHLHLPNFTEKKAQTARSKIEASLKKKSLRDRGIVFKQVSEKKDYFDSVLAALWTSVVKPVLDRLGYTNNNPPDNLPHITWCPTGVMSFLPLHAAGNYKQPPERVFDYAISSYTPTLTALLTSTPSSLNRRARVLAIGQANTPRHSPLPGTSHELKSLKAHTQGVAKYSQLTDNQATTEAVLKAMEQHEWVHLACHAHQDPVEPTKSGLVLHDGTLDLAAINRRSFKNKGLAFLSACQTATGDKQLPDEAIHVASGMLMAGYPSVIATMWSVHDDDAPFVADKVYGQLMKDRRVGNGEAGKALHYAVAALREKVGEKEFGRWVPYIHIGS